MPAFDRNRLVFGLYLLGLIAVFEIGTGKLHLPAWPAFIAMIFFFSEHMDPKKVPHIRLTPAFLIKIWRTIQRLPVDRRDRRVSTSCS